MRRRAPVTRSSQGETAPTGPAWAVREVPGSCFEWTHSFLPQGLQALKGPMIQNTANLCSPRCSLFFLGFCFGKNNSETR